MLRPSTWTARRVQDFTGQPSRSTAQAPQLLVSHPMWVPVRPRLVRMKSTSSVRGSATDSRVEPLIRRVTGFLAAADGRGTSCLGLDVATAPLPPPWVARSSSLHPNEATYLTRVEHFGSSFPVSSMATCDWEVPIRSATHSWVY